MKSLRKAKVEVYKKMNVSGKKERETGNKNMKRRASADRDHQHIRTIWDGEYRHKVSYFLIIIDLRKIIR